MIKINLVKSNRKQAAQAVAGMGEDLGGGQDIQRQGLLRFAIMMLFPLSLWVYEFQMIPGLQSKLVSKRKVLESLTKKNEQARGAVEEIKKFKEDQAKLQRQIDTIENLRRERLKEVKVMDNLQKDIPEKVWLTKLEIQGAKLNLSGLTVADSDLTVFMETLSRSVFLREVNLVRSTEQTTESGILKKFDISCLIDTQGSGTSPEVKQ